MDKSSLQTVRETNTRVGRNSPAKRPWLTTLLAVIVYSISGAAISYPQTILPVTVAVSIGSGIGVAIGHLVARSRLRLVAIAALVGFGLLCIATAHRVLLDTVWLAAAIGPNAALAWSDTFAFGGAALLCAIGLRTSTLRFRVLSVFEVALVSLAFAELLVAHRNGAINRPFEIADPIIAVGGDPTTVFLLFGVGTALLIDLMLLHERSLIRSLIHLSIVAVVLLSTLYTTTAIGLPQPPTSLDHLGLRQGDTPAAKKKPEGHMGQNRGRRRNDQELMFRDDYQSSANRVPLSVVLLHDDFSPPTGVYYFRQSAFSQYNGRRLVASVGTEFDRDIIESFPSTQLNMPEVPNLLGERATLDTTVALLADHKRPFALESPVVLQPVSNPDPGRFRRVYRITSASLSIDLFSLFGHNAGSRAWNVEQFNHYKQAPEDPRYHELAKRIIARLRPELKSDPMAQALAISGWLSREGVYSLRSRHAHAPDPTADFLFGDKTGYCVHFAHAAAFLMRSIGLPTRIAAGYVVEESARRGGSTIVLTGENSHAWPEIFLDGVGWVMVDVIPERSLDPPPQPPDPDLQRLLGEMVRGQRPLPYASGRSFEPMIKYAGYLSVFFGQIVPFLLLLAIFVFYIVKIFRRVMPRLSSSERLPRVVYRAELDRLSELLIRRDYGESRERFALRLRCITPSFADLTRLHLRAVFGGKREIARLELQTITTRIHQELRTSVPRWRRITGVIIPWSWLMSR
ncbi:MAG: transglutaminase domain-containing protein [Deltaproteobacteria bacterium]|nr:transglutaminase domain-containing protein [Deltaproteobacteria bacterium]